MSLCTNVVKQSIGSLQAFFFKQQRAHIWPTSLSSPYTYMKVPNENAWSKLEESQSRNGSPKKEKKKLQLRNITELQLRNGTELQPL